jgi:DNA-binding CsgD family transcriptional regulator
VRIDFISVLEAAYRLDGSDEAWLGGLLDATAPTLDRGLGRLAGIYDLSNSSRIQVLGSTGRGPYANAAVRDAVLGWTIAAPPALLTRMLGRTVFESASQRMADGGGFRQVYAEFIQIDDRLGGMRDQVGLVAVDPSWLGCCFITDLPQVTSVSQRDKVLWERIAAHIGSALRLRRRGDADPEAVLSPNGRIEHATDTAQSKPVRESLTRAAKIVDRARGALRRRSPEEAVAIWTALAAGRWSLVDHFDTDGRRYVVARRNEPEARRWELLTSRERNAVAFAAMGHSNKFVGYELGIAPSTVGMSLARAMRKVGALSRVALIEAYKGHAAMLQSGEA